MQSGCKSGICGHSASAFGNSVSMPIAALGLSGHCNGYRATVAVICNSGVSYVTCSQFICGSSMELGCDMLYHYVKIANLGVDWPRSGLVPKFQDRTEFLQFSPVRSGKKSDRTSVANRPTV